MTDLKDFNKPDGSSNFLQDVLDTLKSNIRRAVKMDDEGAVNVPDGFVKLESQPDGHIKVYIKDAAGFQLKFDSKAQLPKSGQSQEDSFSYPALEYDDKFAQTWTQQGMNHGSKVILYIDSHISREALLEYYPNDDQIKSYQQNYDLDNSIDTTVTVTQPGWVNMAIVGHGGVGGWIKETDPLITDKAALVGKTEVSGSAFSKTFSKAGLPPDTIIYASGGHPGTMEPDFRKTTFKFDDDYMSLLSGLDIRFFNGSRGSKWAGGASGSAPASPGYSPIKHVHYDDNLHRPGGGHIGFGAGMPRLRSDFPNLCLGKSYGSGYTYYDKIYRPIPYIQLAGNLHHIDVGFGGGGIGAPMIKRHTGVSYNITPEVSNTFSHGGGGGAVAMWRVYLNTGTINIKTHNTLAACQQLFGRTINGATFDAFSHGGVPGGQGVVVIEPLISTVGFE